METLFDLLPRKIKQKIFIEIYHSQPKIPRQDDNFDKHLRRKREWRLQRIAWEIFKLDNVFIIDPSCFGHDFD